MISFDSSLTTWIGAIENLERALKEFRGLAKEDKVRRAVEKVNKSVDILVLHQTTRHVDTGDRILEELSKLNLGATSVVKVIGCMPWSSTSDRAGCLHRSQSRVVTTTRLAHTGQSSRS
jgi:hypothetical protein